MIDIPFSADLIAKFSKLQQVREKTNRYFVDQDMLLGVLGLEVINKSNNNSLVIEVCCNEEGILFHPLTINEQKITEVGLYTIESNNNLRVWVVPKVK